MSTTIKRYALMKSLFNLACDYDEVDRYSSFVVFSPDNPWARKLDGLDSKNSDVIGYSPIVLRIPN